MGSREPSRPHRRHPVRTGMTRPLATCGHEAYSVQCYGTVRKAKQGSSLDLCNSPCRIPRVLILFLAGSSRTSLASHLAHHPTSHSISRRTRAVFVYPQPAHWRSVPQACAGTTFDVRRVGPFEKQCHASRGKDRAVRSNFWVQKCPTLGLVSARKARQANNDTGGLRRPETAVVGRNSMTAVVPDTSFIFRTVEHPPYQAARSAVGEDFDRRMEPFLSNEQSRAGAKNGSAMSGSATNGISANARLAHSEGTRKTSGRRESRQRRQQPRRQGYKKALRCRQSFGDSPSPIPPPVPSLLSYS